MTTRRTRTFLPFARTGARRAAMLLAIAVVAAGCASRTPAPVVDVAPLPPPRPAPTPAPAPPVAAPAPAKPEADWRPPTYTVKRGDTLYQIALEHGLDYRELAAWNNIENINLIRVGQELKLAAPGSEPARTATADGGATVTPLRSAPPVGAPAAATAPASAAVARPTDGSTKTTPRALKEPYSEQAVRDIARAGTAAEPSILAKAESARPTPPPSAAPAQATTPPSAPPAAATAPATSPSASTPAPSPGDDEGLDWVWPAKGKLVAQFSEGASLKGIDISGANGDAVVASAPGKVVYAGTGLRGYGKLVIIKHNNTYLTAYAHNNNILVKEGQTVTRGQKIAEMGSTDADRVKLHFEIRRLGKPMDPLRFLPPA